MSNKKQKDYTSVKKATGGPQQDDKLQSVETNFRLEQTSQMQKETAFAQELQTRSKSSHLKNL